MLVAIVTMPGRGLGDDVRLALVLLGVEHLVRDLFLGEEPGEELVDLDRGGADQHGLAAFAAVLDVLDHRLPFLLGGAIDAVVLVAAHERPVGGDDDGLEAVDLLEFVGFRVGRAGHAGQLFVHAEVVLESDRGERLVLGLDAHAFLGFDRLMQPFGPAPAGHERPVNSSTMMISSFCTT